MCDEPQEKRKAFGVGFGWFFAIIKILAIIILVIIKICPSKGQNHQPLCCSLDWILCGSYYSAES